MIDFATLKKALYNWVKTETDVTVIWMDQSEVRPPRPYVGLKLISGPLKLGTDDLRQDNPGEFSVQGLRQFTLSVNAFGADSLALLSGLQTSTDKPTVIETLAADGIGIVQAGQIQDLTTGLDNRFESRHQMDVTLYGKDIETDADVGTIEDVELTEQVQGTTIVIDTP